MGSSAGPSRSDILDTWHYLIEAHARLHATLEAALRESVGLPMADVEVLMRLLKAGERIPSTQLARDVSFSSGGFTKLADRLIDAGLVERRTADRDRRMVLVGLTAYGETVARRSADTLVDTLTQNMAQRLGATGLATMRQELQKLRADT